jgi:hypothetical protein
MGFRIDLAAIAFLTLWGDPASYGIACAPVIGNLVLLADH